MKIAVINGSPKGKTADGIGRRGFIFLPGVYFPRTFSAAQVHCADKGKLYESKWEVRHPDFYI